MKVPYLDQCDRLRCGSPVGEQFWQEMMANARPMSPREFERTVAVARILDDGETLADFMADNPSTQPYRSAVQGYPVYFLQVAGFEFIFAEGGARRIAGR